MNPKVSVIIPTYNRAHLLPRAIRSVLNQTFQDFELIIVDDGSTDKTRQIVEEFERQDPRIKYIWQENFGGPAKPINTGLKIAQGEYIAFLEDDDEWLPEKLKKQIEIFQKYKNVGLVSCYAIRKIDGKEKLFKNPYPNILKKEGWKLFWEKWGIISLSTVIIKRELIQKVGYFDENLKFCSDVDFYMRAIKHFDFYFLSEPLIYYYESNESASKKQFWVKWIPEYEYLIKKFNEDFLEVPRAYSRFLRTLATCYILKGEIIRGREYLKKAIKRSPGQLRLYFQYLLTFLGKNFYKNFLFLRRNLK